MRRDYSDVTDFNQLQKEIEKCFKKWDTIYLKGSNGTSFVSDGVVLNMLRSDIIWLRKKVRGKHYRFPQQTGARCGCKRYGSYGAFSRDGLLRPGRRVLR